MKVLGLSELIRALEEIDTELPIALRNKLRDVAEVVARDVRVRLDRLSRHSANGVISRVRKQGEVTVEQRYRKTTGLRPDWGVTQMRDAFLPAAEQDEEYVAREIDATIEQSAHEHGF